MKNVKMRRFKKVLLEKLLIMDKKFSSCTTILKCFSEAQKTPQKYIPALMVLSLPQVLKKACLSRFFQNSS
jgi:hypothetical protein